MNPFNNRWALLGIVAMFLIVVAELVGPDGGDGVLSRAAGTTTVGATGEPLPPGVVQVAVDPADETPEDDQPQVVMADSPDVVDAEDGPAEEIEEPAIEPDAMGDASFDDSGDEFTDDSGE